MSVPYIAAWIAGAYLMGSIPTGVIVARYWSRADIRAQGSRNIGATNVARVVGKKAGILTLLGDVLKGALPVWAAARTMHPAAPGGEWWLAAVGMAAFLGHLFPVYLKFKGGKGVATASGVFLVAAPWALLVSLVAFVGGVFLTRHVSVGSMCAAILLPVSVYLGRGPGATFVLAALIALGVVLKHHENIARLTRGEEPKWGKA